MTPTTYAHAMEVLLARASGVVLAAFAAGNLVGLLTGREDIGALARVAAGAFVVAGLLLGASALRGRWRPHNLPVLAVLALLSSAAMLVEPGRTLSLGLQLMPATAFTSTTAMWAPRRWRAGPIAAAVAVHAAAASPAIPPLLVFESSLSIVAPALATIGVATAARRAAGRADDAARDRRRLEADAAADVARRQEVSRVQALLHDHVAAALRALSLPTVAEVEARGVAVEALTAWRARPRPRSGEAPRLLREAVEAIPAPPGLSVTTHADDVGILPAGVVGAFERAAAECLRNVARHAGSPAAGLTLRRTGDRVTLVVEDAGRGIGEDRGFGLTRSVTEAMRAVGGEAEVGRGRRGGTRVVLAWSAAPGPAEPTRAELLRAAVVDVRIPLAYAVAAYMAMTAILAARYTAADVAGNLPWLAWMLAVVAATAAVLAVREVPGWLSAGALTLGVVGVSASLAFMPEPARSVADYSTWAVGAISPLLAVLVVRRPPWEAFGALAVHQAVVVGLTVAGVLGTGSDRLMEVTPLALSTVTPTLLAWMLGRGVLMLGGVVRRAEDAHHADVARRAGADLRAAVDERSLTELEQRMAPFLESVVAGGVEGADRRRTARQLELAVRDEMHLPGALDDAARAALAEARLAGARVVVQSAADLADLPPRQLSRVVAEALAPGEEPPAEAVFTLDGAGSDLRLTMVLVPGGRGLGGRLGRAFPGEVAVLQDEADACWVEWRAGGTVGPERRAGGTVGAERRAGGTVGAAGGIPAGGMSAGGMSGGGSVLGRS